MPRPITSPARILTRGWSYTYEESDTQIAKGTQEAFQTESVCVDYDCFYAAVFEAENPVLKSLPLAVQQKHIIVTCNYEARRRGLHKLQLIKEARKTCPDVIIVLGEDLTRFRNASKELYNFLKRFVWSQKVEKLGFDEVFLDVTNLVDYNLDILNHHSLSDSFFHLDQTDPTVGFTYDATCFAGNTFPAGVEGDTPRSKLSSFPTADTSETNSTDRLETRLRLASHLAQYLRHQLEEQKGYTSTVGISTNKLLAKLVGNVNKPTNQTTLRPPYLSTPGNAESNVLSFIDNHDIGGIPGIGYKLSHKLRNHVLRREPQFNEGLVWGGTKENVKVRDVRLFPGMSSEVLSEVLKGPGSHKDIGVKVWGLLHGVDDTDVGKVRSVPLQISIEDSYLRLDTLSQIHKELLMLTSSLIHRMHVDLTEIEEDGKALDEDEDKNADTIGMSRRWLAHPRVLRLTTRPRPPMRADGTRSRTFKRISRSTSVPSFVFKLTDSTETIAKKLVDEALVPLFRKLHPEAGWDLSLMNVAVTDMIETASDDRHGGGRDIGRMFRRQDEVLKEWKIEDRDMAPSQHDIDEQYNAEDDLEMADDNANANQLYTRKGSEDEVLHTQSTIVEDDSQWDSGGEEPELGDACNICGATMPSFAMIAHERFHLNPD
ncbi:hypothetical protein MMC11_007205 [Xylographa trunciseda]|nr:hypothetical protein [Xylographa trunciseda]